MVYHGEVSEDSDGPVQWRRPVPEEIAAGLAARFSDLTLRNEPAHQEAFVHLARDPARTPAAQSLSLETLLAWAAEQHRLAERERPPDHRRQAFASRAGPGVRFRDPARRPGPPPGIGIGSGRRAGQPRPAGTGFAEADGAGLYFERRGDGPPLLMITGGGGDCAYYSAIAGILATDYTVVTYDRRGNSRSLLRGGPATITMAQQSADAVAVLRACGFESAMIFGNSGGATIALDLAATHPQVIQTVVAHEPPVPGS